ncbi:hypothetical protein Golax_025017 [Gossypium laxum]|uniref:Pseudouridine synthase family protein n=1 Tax=Gossypium laxum TaxID=34288 RepID=A0A7J8ZF92_9ROSI|nr:hypothetical protein [Gossypium laxum]
MPFFSLHQAQQCFFLYSPKPLSKFPRARTLFFLCSKMSSNSNSLQNYPTPLSPPLPSISKDIELARAMSASSKSSLFGLSRSDILYEDEWLIAINKPQGIYCDTILASVPRFLSDSAPSDRLCEGLSTFSWYLSPSSNQSTTQAILDNVILWEKPLSLSISLDSGQLLSMSIPSSSSP